MFSLSYLYASAIRHHLHASQMTVYKVKPLASRPKLLEITIKSLYLSVLNSVFV